MNKNEKGMRNMQVDYTEKDWKIFRKRLPEWQENYMEKLCQEYINILSQDISSAESFWTLNKRIREDKKDKGVIVDNMSRSHLTMNLASLLSEGAITMKDLDEFSDLAKESVIHYYDFNLWRELYGKNKE